MGAIHDTVKTVNSMLRTLLALVVVAGAGYAGYLGYAIYHKPKEELAAKQLELQKALGDLKARDAQVAELSEQLDRLELAMRLLKVRHRLARLTVLDQHQDVAVGMPVSTIQFVEIDDEGQPIGAPREFEVQGDLVYVDFLRVTFDDRYIEQADLDRGTAICLFQRIFGEHQQAADGFLLDEVGTRPTAYARGAPMSEFEQGIWNDFWLIANDPERAAQLGIFAAHGSAVSMRVKPGAVYELELRSTGDITIRPVAPPAPPTPPVEENRLSAVPTN
jgi:hypothetical protein